MTLMLIWLAATLVGTAIGNGLVFLAYRLFYR